MSVVTTPGRRRPTYPREQAGLTEEATRPPD